MKSDHFWETFWISFFGIFFISLAVSGVLFISHIQSLNAAAVGVTFDAQKDPFESTLYHSSSALIDGYVYRNALPLGLKHWAWDSSVGWSSTENIYEGSAALRLNFAKEWAGMGINGFSVSRASYQSVSLAVNPDSSVGDLYIELYDEKGVAQARQSIGWYAASGALVPGQWQQVSIPFENLLGASGARTITGISISTKNAGVAYVDAIKFEKSVTPHAVWVAPRGDGPPFNPFATSTPALLPYTATFTPEDFSHWYSYYGLFGLAHGNVAFILGPKPNANTDSIITFAGGRSWSDYHIELTLDWGLTSVFSILTRMTDAQNFASCAFSYYGQTVQIYQVKNGVSTQLAQTPSLPILYNSPWENVSVGASVQGNKVSCYVNGEKQLSADIPSLSPLGSIGLEAWDQNSNSSPHAIKKLEVKQLVGE
jgi:hypothetical protein